MAIERGMVMSKARVAGVDVDTRHWIGGRREASAETFADQCPNDEQLLAEVASGGEAEVAAAVRAASQAFPDWAATRAAERAALLHRSEEHTSELQSQSDLVCRLLLEKKKE